MKNSVAEFGIRVCSALIVSIILGANHFNLVWTIVGTFTAYLVIGGCICTLVDVYQLKKEYAERSHKQFIENCRNE